jgi:hypothetical protein
MSELACGRKSMFQRRQLSCVKVQETEMALRTNTTPAGGHWVVLSLCKLAEHGATMHK